MSAPCHVPPALKPTPKAWQGFRPDYRTGKLFVAICAWCPDAREAESEARRLRCTVTHTICPDCVARMTASRMGEREP